MSWQTGLTDSYLTALEALIDCATNSYISAMAVNAGGTGYAVGDVFSVDGGTQVNSHSPAAEVLTLSGSAVATIRIARGGAMTANPGTSATTTAETGGGSGCTIDTTMSAQQWTVLRRSQQVITTTPTITAVGSGYAVNDVVSLALGQGKQPFDWAILGVDAAWTVASVDGSGGVTSLNAISNQGNYEVIPGTVALPTETAQSGTGLTLTVVWEDVTDKDFHVILEGEGGSGFTDPIVAVQTYYTVDGFGGGTPVRNWLTLGLVTYNPDLALREQVKVSPGFDDDPSDGSLFVNTVPNVPLKELVTAGGSQQMTFWFSIRDRRLMGEFKVFEPAGAVLYPSFYLGHYNQAGTRLEFPYPLYIGASTQRMNAAYSDSTTSICSGILENAGVSNATTGGSTGSCSAYFYSTTLSRWIGLRSMRIDSVGVMQPIDIDGQLHGIYPIMNPYAGQDDGSRNVFGLISGLNIFNFIDGDDPTTPTNILLPTPDTGDDSYLLIPATVVGKTNDFSDTIEPMVWDIFGELDGLFWLSAAPSGSISTEDTFLVGAVRYRVFQNGNRTAYNSSYMAFQED